jgi:hypothetical protein
MLAKTGARSMAAAPHRFQFRLAIALELFQTCGFSNCEMWDETRVKPPRFLKTSSKSTNSGGDSGFELTRLQWNL